MKAMVTISEGLQQVDSRISDETARFTDLEKRLKAEEQNPESTSASRSAIRTRLGRTRVALNELRRARINVQRGFTAESAITVAFGRVSASTQRIKAKREAKKIQATVQPTALEQELQQSLPSDIRNLSFEEVTRGQTLRGGFTALPSLQTRIPTQREQVLQTILPTEPTRGGVGEVLFGEAGKPFVGFDILPRITPAFIPREKDVSLQQVQTLLRQVPTDVSIVDPRFFRGVADVLPRPSEFAGAGFRIGAELIPTTPGEVGITGGLVAASLFAPPIVGTGIGLGVGVLGGRALFDPSLTFEQRAAGGLVGIGGITGAAAGVTPFFRGFAARGTKVASEGFEVLPGLKGVGDIGLIQPGKGARVSVDLPPTSPLVRGGFQVRSGEKAQFLGPEQFLTTSQRGFFEAGRDIPLEREFFVTPQEPTIGIAETRVSRLGLQDPFKFPESVEIGFGLPARPQIGVTIGEVARTEQAGAFAIGRGTELEAIRTTGIITDVTQIGRARIKGQGVDIFEFQVGRAPRGRRPSRPAEDLVSTEFTTRVSGEGILGTLGTIPTRGVTALTSALVSPLLTEPFSPDISIPISPPLSLPISPPISPGISGLISPELIPTVSPPTIPIGAFEIFPAFEDPLRRVRLPRRRKKKEKKVKKGKRITTPTRPSFTGIVLGIEEAAFVDPRFGVSPLQIRGLATGFDVPTRRKKAKVKKKVTKKKKKK